MTYELTSHLKALEQVQHDYTEWFMQVTRRIHYPNTEVEGKMYVKPESFPQWIGRAEEDELVDAEALKSLSDLYRDLDNQAEKLINESLKFRQPPDYEDYDKLALYFEEFINRIRRLEKDCLLEDSGIDGLTGLRSRDVMEKDILEEMDRLARQGKPFVLAMVRIDHYDEIKQALSEEKRDEVVIKASDMIKKSIRSFDDAYRIEEGLFILSLKQTGLPGGVKALMRLKGELAEAGASFTMNGEEVDLSLSSCVVEPMPSDSLEDLMNNLHKDLEKSAEREGAVLEYFETSPLQRFVKETEA